MDLYQRVRVFNGHDFDLDATLGGNHEEVLFGAAVEGE